MLRRLFVAIVLCAVVVIGPEQVKPSSDWFVPTQTSVRGE